MSTRGRALGGELSSATARPCALPRETRPRGARPAAPAACCCAARTVQRRHRPAGRAPRRRHRGPGPRRSSSPTASRSTATRWRRAATSSLRRATDRGRGPAAPARAIARRPRLPRRDALRQRPATRSTSAAPQVEGGFLLRDGASVEGVLDLTGAQIGTLHDDYAGVARPGRPAAQPLHLRRPSSTGRSTRASRLDWLSRQAPERWRRGLLAAALRAARRRVPRDGARGGRPPRPDREGAAAARGAAGAHRAARCWRVAAGGQGRAARRHARLWPPATARLRLAGAVLAGRRRRLRACRRAWAR